MLHCSKQAVMLRRSLEDSITFWPCLQYAQILLCCFLEITEADFSVMGRKHTQSEPGPLRLVLQIPPSCGLSLHFFADTSFTCTHPPCLLVLMLGCQP